jgi:hypothetical protein
MSCFPIRKVLCAIEAVSTSAQRRRARPAWAACTSDGEADPSFGTWRRVTLSRIRGEWAVRRPGVQPDGRILFRAANA